MSDKHDLESKLATVPIFAGLSRRQLSKLVSKSKETRHQAGHEVAKEGEGSLALHLILSGTAEVTLRGDAKRRLGEGDYFGEISLIDGRPRSASVAAETDMTTLAVSHLAFQQLLRDEPTFATELLKVLCARLREAESV